LRILILQIFIKANIEFSILNQLLIILLETLMNFFDNGTNLGKHKKLILNYDVYNSKIKNGTEISILKW